MITIFSTRCRTAQLPILMTISIVHSRSYSRTKDDDPVLSFAESSSFDPTPRNKESIVQLPFNIESLQCRKTINLSGPAHPLPKESQQQHPSKTPLLTKQAECLEAPAASRLLPDQPTMCHISTQYLCGHRFLLPVNNWCICSKKSCTQAAIPCPKTGCGQQRSKQVAAGNVRIGSRKKSTRTGRCVGTSRSD